MGLFNPLNLLFGLSLAALIAIYLRARSRPLIEVSSLTLFAEVPAPVTQSRFLQLDALFWLEALALIALTLVTAGLYFRSAQSAGKAIRHALIFDLGAAMAAPGSDGTRLGQAQRDARTIVDRASASDQFSVISYALEAKIEHGYDARRAGVDQTLAGLHAQAVATRPIALRAALATANDAAKIDLFTDHAPTAELISRVHHDANFEVHLIGAPADNLAIVSLDPGTPKRSEGRALIRNFAAHPQPCELRIEAGTRAVFHSTLLLEPRSSTLVRFGPLSEGGVVHARIVTADGLAADNDRWAWAPTNASVRVIVVSRDRAARDDLARILLAVNPGYRVTAIDGSPAAIHQQAQQQFDLAVLHDFAGEMIAAPNRLYVFPPTDASPSIPLHVIRSVAAAELQSLTGAPPLATPVLLGATRVIALPEWIKPLAQGSDGANNLAALPLAAAGRTPEGWVGMIAFDVRDHALLDPDRQEALLLMIDTLRIIGAPSDRKIVMTGEAVPVATFGPATLLGPDGTSSRLIADKSGQVHFRPLQPGRYALTKDRRTVEIYANYYDEAESDLTNVAVPATRAAAPDEAQPATASDLRAVPQMPLLMAIVILALLLESALMVRRSQPWGSRDV